MNSLPYFKKIFVNIALKYPIRSLLISSLTILIFSAGLVKFQEDYSVRTWFTTDDPLIKDLDEFEKKFGSDESIIVYIKHTKSLFNIESFKMVKEITDKLWHVENVIRVDSFTNYNLAQTQDDDILIGPVISDDQVINEKDIQTAKRLLLKDPLAPNYLISEDGTAALIHARIKPIFKGSPNNKLITSQVNDIINKYQDKGEYRFGVNGVIAINDTFRELAEKDLSKLLPILIILISILLFVNFKSSFSIFASLLVMGVTITSTLGITSFFGIKFNNLMSIVPSILIAICLADCIHILKSYTRFRNDQKDLDEAIRLTIDKNFLPTFLTSFSTSIGFMSLYTAKLIPIKHLGVTAAIGTLLAWLFTFSFFIPLIKIINPKIKKIKNEKRNFNLFSTNLIYKYKKTIIFIFSSLFFIGVYLSTKLNVTSDPYKYFDKNVKIRKINDEIIKNIGGGSGPEIIIKTGKADGIKDPLFLQKVDQFQNWLNKVPHITKTISIVDIIKQMNKTMHNNNPENFVLPKTQNEIAELLLLYTMSLPQGMGLNDRVTVKNDALRLTLLWTISDSKTNLIWFDKIEAKALELGLNAKITGKLPLYQKMNKNVVKTLLYSISLAIFLISVIMVITFRSIKIGLISMIPNVIPLALGTIFLYVFNYHLDLGTVLVYSVCLGISVDDTIHFLVHYFNNRKKGLSPQQSVDLIYIETAPALITTTMILVLGFGTFILGDYVPSQSFGILTAVILVIALLCDLILLPAIFMLSKNKKIKEV